VRGEKRKVEARKPNDELMLIFVLVIESREQRSEIGGQRSEDRGQSMRSEERDTISNFTRAVRLDWLNQSSLQLLHPVRIWAQHRCGALAASVLVSGASA